jgi:hypothetical protein
MTSFTPYKPMIANPHRSGMAALCLMAALIGADAAPSMSGISPVPVSDVGSLDELSITFTESVSGVEAGDLLINGSPASGVTGTGAGPYRFTFTEPPAGTVSVDWTDDHGIAGLGTGAFAPPGAWEYTLADRIQPSIASILTSVSGQEMKQVFPSPGSVVSTLATTTVFFSEAVTGVDASDLLINGQPAGTLSGSGAGPYVFGFNPPANGSVSFTWIQTTGIADSSANLFSNEGWSLTKAPALGTVIISEFLAANGGGVSNTVNGNRDEDFSLSPWIELHNSGSTTVDLTGWSLTNDANDADLWVLPSRTLAAGARLIVWASGKDRKPAVGHLHSNFSLGVSGGYLALHNSNHPRTSPVSKYPANHPASTSYPPQRYDYSYGMQAGDGALRYFSPPSISQTSYTLPSSTNPTPTPPALPQGLANGTSLLTAITPDPTASVSRGFFRNPFSVILSCEQPGAVIRYTTNGSAPLATDAAYVSPIPVSTTTVLRFTAFSDNSVPSESVTHTYLFADQVTNQNSPPYTGNNNPPLVGNQRLPLSWGTQSGVGFPGLITNLTANQIPADYGMDPKVHADPNRYSDQGALDLSGMTNLERIQRGLRTLPVLSVVMKSDDMFGSGGLYPTSTSSNKADNTKPCSLEMFDASGSTIFSSNAGIDNHGNASRDPHKNPKHGYTIRFKERFGNGRLEGRVFPDSPVNEWDKLVLRADFGFSWLHWDGRLQRPRGIRVRDPFCKDSFRDMGGISGHSRFVNLFINGVYWGTYDIVEDQAQDFAESYFGGDKNTYDVVEQDILKNGSATTYREIKRILGWTGAPTYNTAPSATKLASAFTNANYEEIKQHLDVPWHCDYMILHYYIGHEDWGTQAAYDKNWYAIRAPGGKFKYLPWDMENVMNSPTINRVTGAAYPPTAIQPRLTKNPQYVLDFADRVNRHMVNPDGALLPAATLARLDRWTSVMNADAICLESARWGDYRDRVHVYDSDTNVVYTWNGSWHENGTRVTSGTHWMAEINRLKTLYFPSRTATTLGQFRTAGWYPTLNAPEFVNAANNSAVGSIRVSAGFQLKMQLPASPPVGTSNAGTIYYTTDGSDPRVYYDTSGARTTTALAYTSPLSIQSSVTVKARTLNGTTWSALRESTYTVGSTLPRVAISEIHYRPSSGGTSREFIEIHNAGSSWVDTSLWTMDGIGYVFPFGSGLAAGERIVLANNDNRTAFAAAYPSVVAAGYFSGSLDNGNERLTLYDRSGNIISTVHYHDHSPWPTTPDGGGPSLELIHSGADPETPSNWQASTLNHGTPGQPNSPAPAATLRLSEFVTGESGFVEIINSSLVPVSTTGWTLRIRIPGNQYAAVSLPSTVISPGAYLTVSTSLSGRQGTLVLQDSGFRARDGVRYGPQVAASGFGRIGGTWTPCIPSAGSANTGVPTGSQSVLRINEFLAAPVSGQEDWFELSNPSAQAVDLTGLEFTSNERLQRIGSLTAMGPSSHVRLFCDESSADGDTLPLVIPSAGGTLALQTPEGMVLDTVSYLSQSLDITRGRLPDTTGAFTNLPYASPAAPNHGVLAQTSQLNEVLVKNRNGDINPWARRSAWIEIRNPSLSTINMDGWQIRSVGDVPVTWTFPQGVLLPAGSYLRVWADPATPASISSSAQLNCALPIDSEFFHDYTAWGVELLNPSSQVADRITWGSQLADRSIGRGNDGQWSLRSTATPSTANSPSATLASAASVRINEWAGRNITINGNVVNQFIELYNPSNQPVALDALWLGDEPSEAGTRKWRFPSLSYAGPASHALLLPSIGGNDPARVSFNLSGGGEMILLSDESSVRDSVNFGLSLSTRSEGRVPDGGSVIGALIPTPGTSNLAALEGPPAFFIHPQSQSVTAGGSLTLTAAATGATTYQWYRNQQPVALATTSSLILSPLTSQNDAEYHCTATNPAGTQTSETASIRVLYSYALMAAEKSLGLSSSDDDADGLSNGLEFLMGTDPKGATSNPISFGMTQAGNDRFLTSTLRINSRAAYSFLGGELSGDMTQWNRTTPSSIEVLSTDSQGNPLTRFTFPTPPGQPGHFLRLGVEP